MQSSDPESIGKPPAGRSLRAVSDVLKRIDAIDPKRYDQTRNYLDGAVTWLSPYITHGVINTHTVAMRVLEKHPESACYRLLYELAWREYFHRVWQEREHAIFRDIHNPQEGVESVCIPRSIAAASTGIEVLDEGIQGLMTHGWMHNHLRMWVAGIVCNTASTAWPAPAKWLYYHLLDGDLASNTLSWQWVAGTFSHKKYIANQDNMNKYSRTAQHGTWLDVDYDTLAKLAVPEVLKSRVSELDLTQNIPGKPVPKSVSSAESGRDGSIGLRSLWNLNPEWMSDQADVPQVLFIERQHIDQWPMAPHRWDFILHWVNQLGIDVWVGSVEELVELEATGVRFVREEYPACNHWPGHATERVFHFGVPEKNYRSFSQFWKQVR